MTNYPFILFNKSPLQLRLIGARGGRTFGRNQRIRRARLTLPTRPAAVPRCATAVETTAKAIALLDDQFPWLRRAELRILRAGESSPRARSGDVGLERHPEPRRTGSSGSESRRQAPRRVR